MHNNQAFNFEGEILLLYLVNSSDAFAGGIALKNPEVKQLSGRLFIIGIIPESTNDWSSGQKTGIALDQVAHFIEFSSEQEFIEKASFAVNVSAH